LQAGELVLFVDSKKRSYLTTLAEGGEFHTHTGVVSHDDVIGHSEGLRLESTGGAKYLVVRPTLSDYVLKMKRGAQVIYPKDLAQILFMADVFHGARVLEAGVGSGALSMTLLRAGADITGYEIREDFALRATENVKAFLGDDTLSRYQVQIRDVYDGIDETDLDRVVLDLPEPWRVVPHAEKALRPGGLFVAYLPSVTQVSQLRDTLVDTQFEMASTVEILQRGWYVEGRAVRPDHRMVGHTGFLTQARLL
jgi:tRNA (adenine57-N1/adenine58-N1)-methyltransferase